jgi:polysaccharide pyruvyl transferase WcaK-like protein
LGVSIAYESEIDLLSNYGFEAVFVRNVSDVEPMRAKLRCPVEAVPDLAFYHPSPPLVEKNSRKKLGVFVTDYVNPAIDRPIKDFGKRAWSFTEVLARELDSLHEEYDVCLIPCSTGGYGNDRRINLDLAAFMKNEPINIMESLSPSRMIQTIGCLDLTLCMRFHAHIFSIIAGKPFLSIGFTRKVKLLLEENGIDGVEAGKFEEDEFRCENLRDKLTKVAATADVSSYLRIAAENRAKLETLIKRVRSEWLK